MKIDFYSQDGKKGNGITLNSKIYDISIDDDLIHLGLRYQVNNSRVAIAHVKNKAAVRGGGRKPYAQKGTGRARQGGIRNPHYKSGGVAFGPKSIRNFSIKMPRKQRILALLNAFSKKIQDKKVFALEGYDSKIIKTKEFKGFLDNLPAERSILFVTEEKDEAIKRASANLDNVKVILASYLNIYDLLKFEKICLYKNSIEKLNDKFSHFAKDK